MYGAILGDLIGAPWEFKRIKRKNFNPLIRPGTGIEPMYTDLQWRVAKLSVYFQHVKFSKFECATECATALLCWCTFQDLFSKNIA